MITQRFIIPGLMQKDMTKMNRYVLWQGHFLSTIYRVESKTFSGRKCPFVRGAGTQKPYNDPLESDPRAHKKSIQPPC